VSEQLCTFRLADLHLAVPVDEVQEVIREHEITPVPLAPDTVRGLINLRGQIVTVIDLRARLGFPPWEEAADMHVVLRRGSGAVSLLVDDIGDVLEVDGVGAAAPPKTLEGELRALVTDVHKLEERLLLVLSADGVVDLSSAGATA
jgi:purine-binding chemotaxis protein CheW